MATYGFGVYGFDVYGIAPGPPPPTPATPITIDFADYREDRVLGQVSPSETQIGAAAGPLEIGALSVFVTYQDEAGRWLETTSKHTFEQSINTKISNIPASENSETIPNVDKRFMR